MTRRLWFLLGFVILSVLALNWMLYSVFYTSPTSETKHRNWAEVEAGLSKFHNKYYDQDEMYFMAVGWPTLVEATEKLSQVHVKKAEEGWLVSQEQHKVSESSPHRAIENVAASHASIIDSSYIWKHYWEDCWSDRDSLNHTASPRVSYFRLSADPVCTFLWMIKLRQVTNLCCLTMY